MLVFAATAITMPDIWNPAFVTSHPCFRQLPNPDDWQHLVNWPDCAALNALLPADVCMQGGIPVRFQPQDAHIFRPELYYEERIAQHGIVSTRADNWHDFFNALIWMLYPQTKVTISTLHGADLQQYGKPRTPQRDALTLFDEHGVVVAATRRTLLQHALDFDWQRLFWQEHSAWGQDLACFMVGHALLEKMLTPYIGVTAHALLVEVADDFFTLSLAQQQAHLDRVMARVLREGYLLSPLYLNPLPILGVPGWWDNESAAFYQQTDYFRAKIRQRETLIISGVTG
jgi:hypothetical protein